MYFILAALCPSMGKVNPLVDRVKGASMIRGPRVKELAFIHSTNLCPLNKHEIKGFFLSVKAAIFYM